MIMQVCPRTLKGCQDVRVGRVGGDEADGCGGWRRTLQPRFGNDEADQRVRQIIH